MIHGTGRSPRNMGSDRNLFSFANDYSINLRRIATPQNGAEIVSILQAITDNKQRRQIATLGGSLLLRLSKSLLEIFE